MVSNESFISKELLKLYTSKDKEVLAHRKVFDGADSYITFVAKSFRSDRTGIHAQLQVYKDRNQVAYDNINIEKADQRYKLARVAYAHPLLRDISDFYSIDSMKVDLDYFCFNANDTSLSLIDATVLSGDSMLEVGSYIENLVVKGGGTIINGQPKKGKSFIAMAMAVSVDAGCSEIWNVEQANSLYINLERSERSMVKRLGGINTALGLDPARSLPFLNVRGQTLSSIKNNVKKIIQDRDIKFIVLDSISRAGEGSLVEDRTGLAVTDALNNLIEETDKSWLAIAHRGWSDEHIFGSIHFLGACDVMVATNSAYNDNKDLGVKLISEGQNDVPPMKSPVIKLEFDDWGLRAMSKTSEEEFPDLISDNRVLKEKIIDYLTQNGSQTDVQIAIDLNAKKDSVNKALNRSPEVFRKRGKKPIFWNVIND
tara:strand:+ start:522 stop:1802 length:1281 start_codon:yes stop_codon:yes gene_type:complete